MTSRFLILAAALLCMTAQPAAAAPADKRPMEVQFARVKADVLAQLKKTQACIQAAGDFNQMNACSKAYGKPAAKSAAKPAARTKKP